MGDCWALLRLMHPDGWDRSTSFISWGEVRADVPYLISVDHHGALQNKSQYLASLKDLSFKPEEIANSDTTVYVYGNTAIVTSVYRTKGTDDGKPFVHRGRFTDTWVKLNGEWKCVANQETLIH